MKSAAHIISEQIANAQDRAPEVVQARLSPELGEALKRLRGVPKRGPHDGVVENAQILRDAITLLDWVAFNADPAISSLVQKLCLLR